MTRTLSLRQVKGQVGSLSLSPFRDTGTAMKTTTKMTAKSLRDTMTDSSKTRQIWLSMVVGQATKMVVGQMPKLLVGQASHQAQGQRPSAPFCRALFDAQRRSRLAHGLRRRPGMGISIIAGDTGLIGTPVKKVMFIMSLR